ncbi:hypothetical protein AtDm6_2706 [Acetobacter tropicalis]|uniref:DUF2268 domain-containing protein n=2 Tax=Acetobacter tropicalis TaxID=104102 RepID=A0A094YIS4_9PROT|nr:hypothetical protein AtDm6_2706 [Acetobacter tropicalis]
MLSEVRYDHSRWFFGRGSIPRWFGYTLGYEIVGNWLITVRADTVDWINVPAGVPITAAIKSGLIAKD